MDHDNARRITIDVSPGDLLTEVTRAYLMGGNPSAFFSRLVRGVDQYIKVSPNKLDRAYAISLRSQLDALCQEWLAKETKDGENEFTPIVDGIPLDRDTEKLLNGPQHRR